MTGCYKEKYVNSLDDLLPSHRSRIPSIHMSDPRIDGIRDWLQQFDELAGATLTPASGDASFRRYFRATRGDLSRIVMDAPPEKEDCGPFMRISAYLRQMQLNVPEVLASDIERGYLLLTDLGSTQYLDVLESDPARANDLYHDAIGALQTLQNQGTQYQSELPPYDEKLLRFELSIFTGLALWHAPQSNPQRRRNAQMDNDL